MPARPRLFRQQREVLPAHQPSVVVLQGSHGTLMRQHKAAAVRRAGVAIVALCEQSAMGLGLRYFTAGCYLFAWSLSMWYCSSGALPVVKGAGAWSVVWAYYG